MPGREELIQKNKAAVRQNVEDAAELESAYGGAVNAGKKATLPTHRSLFGGNLDVASALDSVEFALKNPLGDGSLRNSVAYIRLWKRGGSGAIASGAAQQIDARTTDLSTDPQSELWGDVANLSAFWQNPSTTFTGDFAEVFDAAPYFERSELLWEGAYDSGSAGAFNGNSEFSTEYVFGDQFSNLGFSSETIALSPDLDRLQALTPTTPTTLSTPPTTQSLTVVPFNEIKTPQDYASSTAGALSGNKEVSSSGVGQLKPANPNGIVNPQSTGSGNRGVGPWLGSVTPPPYSGIAGQAVNGATKLSQNGATLAQGVWQFLFNPSELELVAGPEYKTAETYGVSDKANSGQPLHWTHNRNATLKFNSVLLNGYVFGRKVEQLEQGLIDLFMSRDGGGQSGPHVLEFVWGSRVFGPCVIKDINIKEKMWDEGQVVNAEVSFTLEQIPEWTINDGYVDIARPGKLPLTYDPSEPPAPAPPAPPAGPAAGDGSDKKPNSPSGQKPPSGPLAFVECKEIQADRDAVIKFVKPIESATPDLYFGSFTSNSSAYISLYNKYSKNTFYAAAISRSVVEKCKSPGSFIAEYNKYKTGELRAGGGRSTPTSAQLTQKARALSLEIAGCASGMASAMGSVFNSRCGQFRENPNNTNERI